MSGLVLVLLDLWPLLIGQIIVKWKAFRYVLASLQKGVSVGLSVGRLVRPECFCKNPLIEMLRAHRVLRTACLENFLPHVE